MPYGESGTHRNCTKLDTYSCLNAVTRFIARRGKPAKMIGKNGTSMIGAKKAEFISAYKKQRNEQHLTQQGNKWKSNSFVAAHFGGMWKRLVRSCKKAMYAVLHLISY